MYHIYCLCCIKEQKLPNLQQMAFNCFISLIVILKHVRCLYTDSRKFFAQYLTKFYLQNYFKISDNSLLLLKIYLHQFREYRIYSVFFLCICSLYSIKSHNKQTPRNLSNAFLIMCIVFTFTHFYFHIFWQFESSIQYNNSFKFQQDKLNYKYNLITSNKSV